MFIMYMLYMLYHLFKELFFPILELSFDLFHSFNRMGSNQLVKEAYF